MAENRSLITKSTDVEKIPSFSAVFPGFEKDESKYIHEVAAKFSVENYTTTPTAVDFIDDFEKLLYHQE